MTVYFDHAATNFIDQDVIDFLAKELVNNNYNPAARYTSGIEAAFSIERSVSKIASTLGGKNRRSYYYIRSN